MPVGRRHVVGAAAAVFFLALALPAAALANGSGKCNASACKVYVEPSVPSAGRQPQPPGPTGPNPNGGNDSQGPSKLSRVLAHAGKDKGPLSQLLTGSGPNTLQNGGGGGAPGVLGAALDLGSGPTALLAILLASALALAVHSGVRGWRRRRPSA
jgi:hypothetical protein